MHKGSTYRNIHKHVKSHVHKHMGKHVLKHAHKITHHINHAHHTLLHIGELILIGSFGFFSLMFAASSNLPNNTSFSYPLQKVSTVECRTLYRNDMPDSCKINLPIIHGANYKAYENDSIYRSIYTTLRAAPYSDSWNQKLGAHAGVDMATARGTPLYSIGDGEVRYAGRNSAYGNVVKIKYIYNGEIVYAVYAHMDTMDIKKGDKVVRGQKIGTVGNSGNTFGKLGGYHVHFEIDKDNYGRPAYAYTNCPDLKKGHYKIIQNGLCRTELFTYQYDPIKIFESNSTYIPQETNEEDKIIINETEVVSADTGLNNINIDIIKTKDDEPNVDQDNTLDKWKEIIVQDDKTKDTKEENNTNNQKEENLSHHAPVVEKSTEIEDINEDKIQDIQEATQKDIQEVIIQDDTVVKVEEDKTLLELKFKGVSLLAKHFLSLWDIQMHSDLLEETLSVGETKILDIDIFKHLDDLENLDKQSFENYKKHNGFKGVLQVPFTFIASNKNIDVDINSLQLITKGKAQIKITGKLVGKSSLIIEFGGNKIGILDIKTK